MKISTTIGFNGDPQRLAQQAQDLESAGVDLIWGAEIYGYDLISTLGYIAAKFPSLLPPRLIAGIQLVSAAVAAIVVFAPSVSSIRTWFSCG